MRKVTKGVVSAFLEGRSKRIDNTETDGVSLRLHGNTIAEWRPDGLWITDVDGSWAKIPCNHERSIQHLALIASKQKEVA